MISSTGTNLESPLYLWPITLLIALVVGVVLWLLGRRLARPACAVCGLVLGGLGALAVSQELGESGLAMAWITLGAVAGFLLAFMTFKVWMGLSCAVLLGVALPVMSLVWEGIPAPAGPREVLTDTANDRLSTDGQAEVYSTVKRVYERQRRQVKAWWKELGQGAQRNLAIAGGIGAFIGLVAGLVYPYQLAALETSLVGSMLILFCIRGLLEAYVGSVSGWLPESSRAVVMLLGLITLLGAMVQWTVLKPKSDR